MLKIIRKKCIFVTVYMYLVYLFLTSSYLVNLSKYFLLRPMYFLLIFIILYFFTSKVVYIWRFFLACFHIHDHIAHSKEWFNCLDQIPLLDILNIYFLVCFIWKDSVRGSFANYFINLFRTCSRIPLVNINVKLYFCFRFLHFTKAEILKCSCKIHKYCHTCWFCKEIFCKIFLISALHTH